MPVVQKLLMTGLPPRDDEAWQQTRVRKTLWPPQPGTRRWRLKFGAELVCVRYRQSTDRRYRFTTIEVVVDHAPVREWAPATLDCEMAVGRMSARWRKVLLGVGALWDAERQVWRMSTAMARAAGVIGQPAFRRGRA